MPTLTDIVDRVTAWTQKEICNKVQLKAPPEYDDDPDGAGYEYTLITPTAFPMFVPGKDKLPQNVAAPIPSACVRIADGEDGRTSGIVNMEIWFHVWNPGIHGKDIFNPVEGKPLTYQQWNSAEAEAYYRRTSEGWRDMWNWIDTALRALESTASIDGIPIDREAGIKFSPAKDEGGIMDLYPYWFGYIAFTMNRPIVRNVKAYDEFL